MDWSLMVVRGPRSSRGYFVANVTTGSIGYQSVIVPKTSLLSRRALSSGPSANAIRYTAWGWSVLAMRVAGGLNQRATRVFLPGHAAIGSPAYSGPRTSTLGRRHCSDRPMPEHPAEC